MKRILTFSLTLLAFLPLLAQNPIIGTSYTPDPAPYVHGDKVYCSWTTTRTTPSISR